MRNRIYNTSKNVSIFVVNGITTLFLYFFPKIGVLAFGFLHLLSIFFNRISPA